MSMGSYDNLVDKMKLGVERRAIFNYYLKALSLSLVDDNIYACNLEKDVWDTRVVDLNTNTLYRFSNPRYTDNIENLNNIRKQLSFLMREKLCGVLSLGIIENQIWYSRKLFPKENLLSFVLDESKNSLENEKEKLKKNINIFENILDLVNVLWENEIYHGDINEENIVKDGGSFILVDPIFSYTFSQKRLPSKEDDIEGLKSLFEKIFNKDTLVNYPLVFDLIENGNLSGAIKVIDKEKDFGSTPLSSGVLLTPLKEDNIEINNDSENKEEEKKEEVKEEKVPQGVLLENNEDKEEKVADKKEKILEEKSQEKYIPPRSILDNNLLLYFILICAIVLVGYKTNILSRFNFSNNREKILNYEYEWGSNKPILMKKVLDDALQGDEDAIMTIVNFASEEGESVYVNKKLLNIIFNPLWEDELSEDDKYTALRISLSKLVPRIEKRVPLKSLSELHPSIALAVSSVVSLSADDSQFKDVTLEYMSNLGDFYGRSFKKLSLLGIKSLSEISARALSQILVNGESEENLKAFFLDTKDDEFKIRAKILILLDLYKTKLVTQKGIYEVLKNYYKQPLDEYFKFFGTSDWKDVRNEEVVDMLVGLTPNGLGVLQYIDLLSFPIKSVRFGAVKFLSTEKVFNKNILEFIASGDSKLTRKQIYLLLSSFLIEGTKQDAVISAFFEEKPDDLAVLTILLFRKDKTEEDYFNLMAARYLGNKNLNLPEKILLELSNHPEPMARAIAYLNLDLAKHKDFLEERKKDEKSDMLKVLIAKRLND